MRKIHLMNEAARNAQVVMEPVRKQDGPTTGLPGKKLAFKRYVATTETGLHARLAQQHGDALAQALMDGDPEIDRELVGREVGERTTLELLNAENDAAVAELALLQARVSLLLDRLHTHLLQTGRT